MVEELKGREPQLRVMPGGAGLVGGRRGPTAGAQGPVMAGWGRRRSHRT